MSRSQEQAPCTPVKSPWPLLAILYYSRRFPRFCNEDLVEDKLLALRASNPIFSQNASPPTPPPLPPRPHPPPLPPLPCTHCELQTASRLPLQANSRLIRDYGTCDTILARFCWRPKHRRNFCFVCVSSIISTGAAAVPCIPNVDNASAGR